ncbi:hypothetical protein FA13DRAFT_1778224 [Coprinellus micaceus]|uniref:NAD(P)-binding protein n=1 Tax=Coprinellus micaceus TaxID=71717 RepID=A0A4Y7SP76_COPMI|nr:hypothetical protein FA13DRAFT_1778224 [Coprinellus micaceus]
MRGSRSRNASPLRPGFGGAASFKVDTLSIADDMHPVIHAGRVAVVTGAASGIGKAAAIEFASCPTTSDKLGRWKPEEWSWVFFQSLIFKYRLKLKVAIADTNEEELKKVGVAKEPGWSPIIQSNGD